MFFRLFSLYTSILFLSLQWALNLYAENKCIGLFPDQTLSHPIDDKVNVNAFIASAPKATNKQWDIATMGVLSELYDLKQNPKNGRSFPEADLIAKPIVEARTKKLLSESDVEVTNKHLEIIDRTVKIESLTEDTVLVSLKNFMIGKEHAELESAIKNYFSLTYIKTVNWVYRLYNLEKNETMSSMVMMDEVSYYAAQLIGFEFNLIYDKKVIEKHLKVIAKVIEEYEAASGADAKAQALRRLQIEMPLMPIGGVTVVSKIVNPNAPVELKRYFKSEIEDPLGLADVKPKDEFKLRHAMLYKAIERLPIGQQVEIHAHTRAHVIAYAKLGFVDTGRIVNPKYPEVEVRLLKANREVALAHIKAILDGLE